MSYDPTGGYYRPARPPVQPKPRRPWWVWPIGLVLLLCVGGTVIAAISNGSDGARQGVGTVAAPASPGDCCGTAPLVKSDIVLTVKTTKKDCFGSAGCNVEYQLKATLPAGVEAKDCDLTYEVHGLEDTQTGTLKMHSDNTYEQDSYQAGQTSSSSKKLTAKVTDIDCGG